MRSINIQQLTVLLVEPSQTQHKVIAGDLARLGVAAIDWVTSASDALDRMQETKPDLVISAMHLPDMTGTDLIQSMRGTEELLDIPFMLISSETSVRYLTPLRQAGAIAILPKPYDLDQLNRALFTAVDFLEPDIADLEDYDLSQLRVLVVDDSFTSRHQIKRLFGNIGVTQIVEASNGKEAVAQIGEHYFDLVVTDYNMPEMDGGQLTEYIRRDSQQAGVPILMITSEHDRSRLASVEQSGVSALCDKPFEPQTILRILKTAVLELTE